MTVEYFFMMDAKLMDRSMNDLNLSTFIILDTQQDEHDLHFFLETVSQPSICPCCGSIKGDIVGYGRDMQIFMDDSPAETP